MSRAPEYPADSPNVMKPPAYCSIGSRREILAEVKQAVADGVSIIVVHGRAGVGKSAFCRAGIDELPEDCISVFFSSTVESFEDVVRTIAGKVGCGSVDVSRTGMVATIDEIRGALKRRQKRLVTVFDGAEMIYLATLERIRKMLDQLNVEEISMQVVFCGRPLLLENLRQLSI